jgi:solute carrier family 66 (lysosomal lysine-arginine transporter), member 1
VWFLGDVTNFIGAAWAGLVPTVIALAVYFCFADFVLISQCIYYNVLNARRDARAASRHGATEADPLLVRRSSTLSAASDIGLPGSHRRRRSSAASSHRRAQGAASYVMDQIAEEDDGAKGWLRNLLSVLFVCLAGAAGWLLAWKGGAWAPAPSGDGQHEAANLKLGPQILGYTSAIAYLGYDLTDH